MSSIGLDMGRSAVKMAITAKGGVKTLIIPTAVCSAINISDETEAVRAKAETVKVGDKSFFIGETALIQGGANVTGGLSDDWIDTPEHIALMIGSFKKAVALCDSKKPRLVMGLPTHLYSTQKAKLIELAKKHFDVTDVHVIAQPVGPYFERVLKADGTPALNVNEQSWAVIDVGFFSTDFMLTINGRWVERASGVCSGAHIASEQLQKAMLANGHNLDLAECEKALREKTIRNFGTNINVEKEVADAIEPLANQIVDTAKRMTEPYARKLDGIIIAGGGAEFMFEALKDRWPNASKPESARLAIAEGMRRFGAMMNIHSMKPEE